MNMPYMLKEADANGIREILCAQLSVTEAQLAPEARIQEDLGADSLDVMEIVLAVEERFHLSIPDEKAEHISTVSDLMEALAEALGTGVEARE